METVSSVVKLSSQLISFECVRAAAGNETRNPHCRKRLPYELLLTREHTDTLFSLVFRCLFRQSIANVSTYSLSIF